MSNKNDTSTNKAVDFQDNDALSTKWLEDDREFPELTSNLEKQQEEWSKINRFDIQSYAEVAKENETMPEKKTTTAKKTAVAFRPVCPLQYHRKQGKAEDTNIYYEEDCFNDSDIYRTHKSHRALPVAAKRARRHDDLEASYSVYVKDCFCCKED